VNTFPNVSLRAALAALLAHGCSVGPVPSSALVERRAAYAAEDPGAQDFLLGDFDGLSRETLEGAAVPWKLACTGLLLFRNPDDVPFNEVGATALLQRYGLFRPAKLGNWPERTPPPVPRRPLGVVTGRLELGPGFHVEVANLGCAACHAGRGYGADGAPTQEAWLGLPNGSFDLDAWSNDLLGALLELSRMETLDVLAEVRRAFPELSDEEERGLRFVLPRLRERLEGLEDEGRFTGLQRAGPGRVEAVAALGQRLGVPAAGNGAQAAASAVPLIAGGTLRSALWWDGLLAPRGKERFVKRIRSEQARAGALGPLPAACAVAMMGVAPSAAAARPERFTAAYDAVLRAKVPAFPGPVDESLVARGEDLFRGVCGSCHGSYDRSVRPARLTEFPNRVGTADELGTDPARWQHAGRAEVDALTRSPLGERLAAKASSGYVAPPLSGAWATAPYLHNDSVPTLEALLDPQQRPATFLVGGHRLDLARVGVAHAPGNPEAYPSGYKPWSTPALYDTTVPGQSNAGHEAQVSGLSADQRKALLEYLKVL
jgi:mono/diheme cytochrome c family protein